MEDSASLGDDDSKAFDMPLEPDAASDLSADSDIDGDDDEDN